mmetsp:Transcript_16892/g.45093  ORF Transcript_16892/g.45093 Transcript_16892/m.45093 type:complete len:210 (+) Transcript_16892:1046-1675(+)
MAPSAAPSRTLLHTAMATIAVRTGTHTFGPRISCRHGSTSARRTQTRTAMQTPRISWRATASSMARFTASPPIARQEPRERRDATRGTATQQRLVPRWQVRSTSSVGRTRRVRSATSCTMPLGSSRMPPTGLQRAGASGQRRGRTRAAPRQSTCPLTRGAACACCRPRRPDTSASTTSRTSPTCSRAATSRSPSRPPTRASSPRATSGT